MVFNLCTLNGQSFTIGGIGYDYTANIFTCKGAPIRAALARRELTSTELAYLDNQIFNGYYSYLGITRNDIVADATAYYNCHAYAWHLTEGNSNKVWINNEPYLFSDLDPYWSGSTGCFVECAAGDASKIYYHYEGQHSAVNSSVSGKYESKWSQWYVIRHKPDSVPYMLASYRKYYAKPAITGANTVCYSGNQFVYSPSSVIGTITWTLSKGCPFSFNPPDQPALMQKTTSNAPHQLIVYRTGTSNSSGTLLATNGSGVVTTKTLTPCVPSISGPSLCYNSGNYTLNNPPSGTIYWTIDNNSYSVTSSGNPTTVSYTGPFNGASVNLSARTGSTGGLVITAINIDHCSPSISGSSYVCTTGSSFTLNNPPPGTIYWSVDDPTIFTVSPSGNPTTVTRIGTGNDNVKLRARTGSTSGTIITDLILTPCPVSATAIYSDGNGNICNAGSSVFSITTGQYASWSVTAGFNLSTNYGVSTTVSAVTPNQYGTLTAVTGGVTYTKYIQSLATPGCNFPKTDYVTMGDMPCGASLQLNPFPSDNDLYAVYKWVVLYEDNVSYDITSGSDAHSVNVQFAPGIAGDLRIDAYQFIYPYGYSPHPTVEYRLGTWGCKSAPSLIKVYPNPVSDILNIEITDKAIDRARAFAPTAVSKVSGYAPVFDIRLYDVLGSLVRQQTSKGGTERFNVSGLPNGIYFLNVDDGISKTPETIQIIVRH